MSDRTIERLLRVAVVFGGALAVVGSGILLAGGHGGDWWSGLSAFSALFAVFFAVFVWLVIGQQPRNAVVWTMAASAFWGGVLVAGVAAAVLVVDDPSVILMGTEAVVPAETPAAAAWILMFTQPAAFLAFFPLVTFGLLLFPDGTLPSPRWRMVGIAAALAIGGATLAFGWGFRPGSTAPAGESLVLDVLAAIVSFSAVFSLAALLGRFRRSSGPTRQQFKWVVWGAAIFVPVLVATVVVSGSRYEELSTAPLMVAEVVFLSAYGIAVGRYRLYDIDLVISKTVAYVMLAVDIAALYTGAVLGLIFLFGDADQRSGDLGVALPLAATALVAVVFEPLRVRLQRWSNRLVYGKRAEPAEVLSRLTSQLADTSAGEGLAGLADLLRQGTGAEEAQVWLRVGNRLRLEATAPPSATPSPTEAAAVADLPHSELELSLPVRHGDEVLGALGVTKPRSYPITPADEELLADVAAGTGLLLRNLRLNAELAERAAQLQASRRRLIAAHDAARHRLERDLHDGAQQQVVALKVKLGLAKTIAEREGAAGVATRVEELAGGTQSAVDAMRLIARGIYPPLLEAEGLGAALTAVSRTSGLPLRIDAGGLPRYSRQVEETIYFCVLAAVGRAEMQGASAAEVTLSGDPALLTVTVTSDDAGGGTELTPLRDRLDAFGGTVAAAEHAATTTLTMRLPVAGEVLEPA